jgi:molybdenum cofactor biosynthesis protein A
MRFPLADPATPLPAGTYLVDRRDRRIDYLRIAVTDHCNLRCSYCMPPAGIRFLARHELLKFEEIMRLAALLVRQGVKKIRITGGEPFMRSDLLKLAAELKSLPGMQHLHITTNGVLAASHLEKLRSLEISGINLSLDTLRRHRFRRITGRDFLPQVLTTFRRCLELGIPLKINAVVQQENLDELVELASLAKEQAVEVRFIEPMPFNGGRSFSGNRSEESAIRAILQTGLPPMTRLLDIRGTAFMYEVRGFRGRIGIIAGHSRKFCAQCNKVRLTPAGSLKTCLYAAPALNLREMLRTGCRDEQIGAAIRNCVAARPHDGLEAAATLATELTDSMACIGG